MIIGHLPAGYLYSDFLFKRTTWSRGASRVVFLAAGMAGALAPDLDMLYFYFADHRRHHHHTYFSHYPSLWAALLLLSVAWHFLAKRKSGGPAAAIVFALNGLLHMALDTVVGDIWWLAPLASKPFSFATVPALYHPWWLNFILHWSFLFELALVAWAIVALRLPQPLRCR